MRGIPAFVLLAVAQGQAAPIEFRILDENGRPAAARVRVFDEGGLSQAVTGASGDVLLAAHPNFPELGAIVSGQARIELPTGAKRIVVDRGPEYRRVELTLDGYSPGRTVRLKRWIHMSEKGWWSGDMHVHRAPGDLPKLLDAADLHFAPTLTRWNAASTLDEWPSEPVIHAAPDRVYSVNNAEDERHWGAALFLGLRGPVRLYNRDAEYPPPYATWSQARSQGGFIDLEKLIWWEAPVMAALAPPDSIGVAVNHFREDGISTRASLARPRDEQRYPGEQGFARYILDLYATYLSAGFRIPASAGSANGVVKIHFGYNRSYVYLGRRFSYTDWLAGQKAGRNFVTNGPMLFVNVNSVLPGSVLPGDAGEAHVQIDALSAADLDRAEILVDGAVVRTIQSSASPSRIRASVTVTVRDGSWLAVRCFEKNPVTMRLAHTSPFYFGKSPRRSAESLAHLRSWVEAEMDRLKGLPVDKLTSGQKDEFLALCRKALDRYRAP